MRSASLWSVSVLQASDGTASMEVNGHVYFNECWFLIVVQSEGILSVAKIFRVVASWLVAMGHCH